MAKTVESLRIFLKNWFFAEKIDWNMTELIQLCSTQWNLFCHSGK